MADACSRLRARSVTIAYMDTQHIYRSLPNVDALLADPRIAAESAITPRSVMLAAIRSTLDQARAQVANHERTESFTIDELAERAILQARLSTAPSLHRVINATGIIVHTNLGRSILAQRALDAVVEVAAGYSTLEYTVSEGQRGSRHDHIESLICELTGAEAAMAVNNNAAAVMMAIACFSRNKEAIVSRGQLVEIGGSFRVPAIMAESGARMVEVGTTNKTHLADYEQAITPDTGLLLKVHSSNYCVVGFTSEVSLEDLVALGAQRGIPVIEDQGSGVLIDLSAYGLGHEPTVQQSVAAGATLVTFSGDKLLGGPQAGLICGKATAVARLKKHPMARALRLDKMTLAALEATLMLYREPERAVREIPTLRALTKPLEECRADATHLAKRIGEVIGDAGTVEVIDSIARAGGGALPLAEIPSAVVAVSLSTLTATEVERSLRLSDGVPIIVRIGDDKILLDPRTFVRDDADQVVHHFAQLV